MKRYFGISLACMSILVLVSSMVLAKPADQLHNFKPVQDYVDVVGDVDGTAPVPSKAANDTTWIGSWNFEGPGCDDTGWVRSDNRIINDGNVYWYVDGSFTGTGNIVGNAAVCGDHDLCWVFPDGYDNDWNQGICIEYVGDSYLSFDWLVDTEGGFDFLQVETDSACSSFDLVDYAVDPEGNAAAFRDLVWSVSGFDTTTARVDSLFLTGYGTADTHCVYIVFFADGAYSPADGLQPSLLGIATAVDNVLLQGGINVSEDFTSFTPGPGFDFVNLADSEPFGQWARTFQGISDNDICTENTSCAWLATDHTTPTIANVPSMLFGPGGYVIKNWFDEVLIGPWTSLATTPNAIETLIQFDRFPGNFFSTSRAVQNWSVRGKSRVSNTDTPAPGDSIDCVSSWGHNFSWNSLSTFRWQRALLWDMTAEFDPSSTDIQMRFRESDWQWIAGASPPAIFQPGPGPYWDNVRIGRRTLLGPVIDEGIDARYQAQDAAPNDPANEQGPLYAQLTGVNDIFGTTAFSRSNDGGINKGSARLIIGDSITVDVLDQLGTGGVTVEVYASIVSGPHAGKAPAPYTVGGNGFFVVTADSARTASGLIQADRYFVDLDDTYFRGGDALRYMWFATDQNGGITTDPGGLTAIPTSVAQAELGTGGLFEVNFLPTINWDPAYLARIAADQHGDLEPTQQEIDNSSQKNCILYYNHINSRRRSGDTNRTSFMYTLDVLGYRGQYDVYDHTGLGNTNNALGSRISPSQARFYSLVVMDAGNRGPGAPILPDGIDIDAEKIDQGQWFIDYLNLAGGVNPDHTLWILGSNVVEEKDGTVSSSGTLLNVTMSTILNGPDQAQNSNPEVFGISNFTNHNGTLQAHSTDAWTLAGGCPIIRNYDDLGTVSGTVTHEYGTGGSPTSGVGAVTMNANVAGNYSTIMQSHPWFDMRDTSGGPIDGTGTGEYEDIFIKKILAAALDPTCDPPDPGTDVGDDVDQIEVPRQTSLHQNTPNPFNPMTTISFDLARDSQVSLKIYDVAGRLVRNLVNEPMVAGFGKQVVWNGLNNSGSRVSSGVYFYRLVAGDFTATKKMVVMK